MLITWFADEIYRFCEVPPFQAALTDHYGGEDWRSALTSTGEHARKEALMSVYRERLESLPNARTGALSISSKKVTPQEVV